MRLHLRYYGKLSETAGCETEEVEIPDNITTLDLKYYLLKRYPDFTGIPLAFFASNKKLEPGARLEEESYIECMPPFSGG